jgi:hypothetical protein
MRVKLFSEGMFDKKMPASFFAVLRLSHCFFLFAPVRTSFILLHDAPNIVPITIAIIDDN